MLISLATALVAGAIAIGSGATFSSQSTNSGNVYTAGTLTQSNNVSGALVNLIDVKPGDQITKTVTIKNTGTLPARFSQWHGNQRLQHQHAVVQHQGGQHCAAHADLARRHRNRGAAIDGIGIPLERMLQREGYDVIHVGEGLHLDARPRRVWIDKMEVALTAKEFEVRAMLDEDRGTVVKREQLIDEVWENNWIGSTKVFDVVVGRLRQKLEDKHCPAEMVTVRRVGFRLEDKARDA